jgi:plasmid maintenance system antidote protein VapI
LTNKSDVLRAVLLETGTTQSELSRLNAVRRPNISQFVSGRVEMSDDMLEGYAARASASRWSGVRSSAS